MTILARLHTYREQTEPVLSWLDGKAPIRTIDGQQPIGVVRKQILEALLGLVPIRAHGAERPLRREHGRVMHEWLRSGAQLLRASVAIEAVQITPCSSGDSVMA